ncbi:MAG: hypothetical protein IH886_09285 [Nitrospinae bacterium]|nr:hypothetical protein [Nitrospinota bacterium]
MTDYINFLKDFPDRCLKIWKQEQAKDKEVTLSLMVASAGFVISFERLKSSEINPTDSKKFKELREEKFLKSELHPKKNAEWLLGEYYPKKGDLDQCDDLNNKKKIKDHITVGDVLNLIRNALAHGAIHTRANPEKRIELIVFVSGSSETKKNFIGVAPEEFSLFLENWFNFLKKLDLTKT